VTFAVALLVAAPATAHQALPREGHGTVGVFAGWRLVPDPGLIAEAKQNGRTLSAHLDGGVAFAVPFTYFPTADVDVSIEAGYAAVRHRYTEGGALDLNTFTLLVTSHFTFARLGPVAPYAGGGFGYYLNTAHDAGRYVGELNAAGLHLALGARIGLGAGFGLYVEDRYAFAWVPVNGVGTASVGGNSIFAGLYYGWMQDNDRGGARM
jgi:hypothetical protein